MAQYEIYSDIHSEFTKDTNTKDLQKVTNLDAIKNALRNILRTKKLERRMIPTFGASLEQVLFEPIDETTAKMIGSILYDELLMWEPRIKLINIEVIARPDDLQYKINIEYEIISVLSKQSSDKISFILGGI